MSRMPPANNRIAFLKQSVQESKPGICTERAVIWTKYCKNAGSKNKPFCMQIAEAFESVLLTKTVKIYPHELIVGNFTSKRVGGQITMELLGVPVMQDIFKFPRRKTNPLQISPVETWMLLRLLPFWIPRFLAIRAYKSPIIKIQKLISQLRSHFYVMNEAGGVAHTIPDHEKLLRIGVDGLLAEIAVYQGKTEKNSEAWQFYEAIKISLMAFATFCDRYHRLALDLLGQSTDEDQRRDLADIAASLAKAPRKGATTFREALQLVYLVHIAIMMESLDNSIGLGRMDQYLYPYYRKDIENGILTKKRATELIAAFSIKMCELVPVFPEKIIQFHGGFYNAQVVTVGGMDAQGNDATNDLTYIFLDVMNTLRMREPNYHSRIHAESPTRYFENIVTNLCSGSNTPALYNDDIIITNPSIIRLSFSGEFFSYYQFK